MRTTIEITAERRARLITLAVRRGEKGFSKLVQQALGFCLKAQAGGEEKRRRALLLKGSLAAREADRLRTATRETRESSR